MSLQANTGTENLNSEGVQLTTYNTTIHIYFYGILNKLGLQLLCLHLELDGLHYRPKLSWCRPNIHHKGRNVSFDFLT